jgi:hypothetical protein
MLPFKPEPINKLKQRYTKALERIWVAEKGMIDVPSHHRENVFDFQNGLRLIISRDVLREELGPQIHVSASFFTNPPKGIDNLMGTIVGSFLAISGRVVQLNPLAITPKGIPHFVVEDVN